MQTTLIIIAVCMIISAFFSACEMSFSSVNRVRIKSMAEQGNSKAQTVLKMLDNYDNLLSTILVGNNVVNILCSSMATVLFIALLDEARGPGVATIVTTVVILLFGEISPKSIAKESPEKFAMALASILNVIVKLFTPINWLFGLWKKMLSLIIKKGDEQGITEAELLTYVDEAQQGGGIDEQEGSLIRSALGFTDLEVQDIFTPRIEIVSISTEMSNEEIETVFMDSGYSRLPIHTGNDIDQITGTLYQKDFYRHVIHGSCKLEDVVRPAFFTSKYKTIGDLLKQLQHEKQHIAIVIDEYGCTAGLVTMEDILEEIVGDIWDEYDVVSDDIVTLEDGTYQVAGTCNVEALFDFLGHKKEFEMITVNGWLMEVLGRIPAVGDSVQEEGITVTVTKSNGRRAEQVHVSIEQ
ncbi:MAG: HlyC/CorC family transporter [Peptococcaceae bacterium]|nr:HlyC/CorC family transporter [Peptococcaceae bacterium]